MLHLLRCPVSKTKLTTRIFSKKNNIDFSGKMESIENAVLLAEQDWFYPVIDGIPRMQVEAFLDYKDFLEKNFPSYHYYRNNLFEKYPGLIKYVVEKNRKTKKSFELEWGIFNYEKDRTWSAGPDMMLKRFCEEIAESQESLHGKLILDAGCGNGMLNQLVAAKGATIIGMDISKSVERAEKNNSEPGAVFIQGDLQFPPFAFASFDIVHCSGVLIHTNNTEQSFRCIETCVKANGKLSAWLYHPRKDLIHNLMNFIRRFTSRLPLKMQYYLYLIIFFPLTYIIKRFKGNKQKPGEMLVEIIDWLSPEFRWEHHHDEVTNWFYKCGYKDVKITANETFGFNITGVRQNTI